MPLDSDLLYFCPHQKEEESESRGSTDSLTSILHHDSYQDELSSNDEEVSDIKGPAPGDLPFVYQLRYFLTPGAPATVRTIRSPNPAIHKETLPQRAVLESPANRRPRFKPNLPVEATKPSEVSERLLGANTEKPMKRIVARRHSHSSTTVSATLEDDQGDNHDQEKTKSSSKSKSLTPNSSKPSNQSEDHNTPTYSSHFSSKSTTPRSDKSRSSSVKPNKQEKPVVIKTWEDWFVNKEKMLREKRLQENEKLKANLEVKRKEKEAKEAKSEIVKVKVDEWVQKKKRILSAKSQKQKEGEAAKHAEEEKKKQEIAEKASVKYQEWLAEEKKKRREREAKELKMAQQKAEEENKKREKAQKVFQEWLAKHSPQQQSLNYSYGYTDGKLTAYYNRGSAPPPAFVNPEPWLPPPETLRRYVS